MNALMVVMVLMGEGWLLYDVGLRTGALPIFVWVLLAILAGVVLVRRQFSDLRRLALELRQTSLHPFRMQVSRMVEPERVADTMLLMLAAALFILPGLVSDVVAFALLVPAIRRQVAIRLFPQAIGSPSASRPKPVRSAPNYRARADIEVIPPGRMRTPFQPRPRIIDVN